MLIGGILLGLIAGLLAGGSIANLASVRLRWVALLLVAVIVRFLTELGLEARIETVQALRLPLFGLAFGVLLVGLWVNRSHAGLTLAFVGILLNTIAILANAGYMPIWRLSFEAAGFDSDTVFSIYSFHRMLDDPTLNANFLLRAGPLGDILPIPIPVVRNVASIGDVFLSAGLGFFLFASVLRSRAQAVEEDAQVAGAALSGSAGTAVLGRPVRATDLGKRVRPATGLAPGFAEASVLRSAGPPRRVRGRPLTRIGPCPGPANPDRRGRGPDPAPPIRPAGPQQLVLGIVGRPAHQPVRRPDPPDRPGLPRLRPDELAGRGRVRIRLREPAEPVPLADRGNVCRSLGSEGRHGRQRPDPRGDHPGHPDRGSDEHLPRLSADLRGHVGLDLLPPSPDRGAAADRPGG